MKNRVNLFAAFMCGVLFIPIEVAFRALNGSMISAGYEYPALMGFSSLHMIWVAGITMYLVGRIAPDAPKKTFSWFLKILKGAFIGTLVEFISGCILNLWLGLHIWDYSHKYGNVLGQISPEYALYWLLIIPFGLWLDDSIEASAPKVPRLRDYYLKPFLWWLK